MSNAEPRISKQPPQSNPGNFHSGIGIKGAGTTERKFGPTEELIHFQNRPTITSRALPILELCSKRPLRLSQISA
jgi:hypothetical protein